MKMNFKQIYTFHILVENGLRAENVKSINFLLCIFEVFLLFYDIVLP